MALAAQQLRLVKADRVAKVVHQLVALGGVVAIQTPDAATPVLQILQIGHHGGHRRDRGWLFAGRQLGRRELGSNPVMTGYAAQWHQGELFGARLDECMVGRKILYGWHGTHGHGAVKRVAPPQHGTRCWGTFHVGPAGLKVALDHFGCALAAFKAGRLSCRCRLCKGRRNQPPAKGHDHRAECEFFHDGTLTVVRWWQI